MSPAPDEGEIRSLLSKALSRRRRKADSLRVRSAQHLDLNREFKEKGGHETIKYLVVALILEGLLYFVCNRLGLS